METPELIFATGNQAKLKQMAFVIARLGADVRLVNAHERYGDQANYDEEGDSPAAIAVRGAKMLARRLGTPIVVEDTSFHVDALGGRPGVQAGAYLREKGRKGILEALKGQVNRKAKIISAVAWAAPWGDTYTWVTAVEGWITFEERWTEGMPEWVAPSPENPLGGGYNAIFVPRGASRTLAEIPPPAAMAWGYREPNFCAVIAFMQEHAERWVGG
ncbi:MAG TPA: non-canonical purine NTP pyrophosphatase [Chloroflexi bacterium]|nr:non-canonical purine NTP pyrophosphatase [Chloroflexota bacterium]